MTIRDATASDLPRIVDIYNASIPGRMATSDLAPVTVDERRAWFQSHHPDRHPLWVLECDGQITAWLGTRAFYGRPAYHATVEVAIYVAPESQKRGYARRLLNHLVAACPRLGIRTVLAFVFAHNEPSLRLFATAGFEQWGHLPRVAELDAVERDVIILGRRVDSVT